MVNTFSTSNGHNFIVSDEDVDLATNWRWFYCPKNKTIHRGTRIDNKETTYQLRRLIAERLGLSLENDITTKNLDPCDLRRENLQATTRSQSSSRRNVYKNNTTGFKGVTTKKNKKGFYARICDRYIGTFLTAVEAARAYDKEAFKLWGPVARLNFPEEKC